MFRQKSFDEGGDFPWRQFINLKGGDFVDLTNGLICSLDPNGVIQLIVAYKNLTPIMGAGKDVAAKVKSGEGAKRPVPLHHGGAELGVSGGRQIAEAAMRSDGVVVVLPGGERRTGMIERGEQGLVQELVPETAVEALDEGVLLRLPLIVRLLLRNGLYSKLEEF